MDFFIWYEFQNTRYHTYAFNHKYLGIMYTTGFWFSSKILVSIMFLILIRGGTPRYRYDYLTKLGWLKFIGIALAVLATILFFFVM